MKRKNNVSLLSAGLTALMLTMGTGQALAEDEKTYPASFCTPISNIYVQPFSINAGEWVNLHDSAVKVECPIIKERMGSSLRSGFVRVIDRNPFFRNVVECDIISRRTHIFPHQGFSTHVESKGFDADVQTLRFGSLGHNGENTTYTMACTVPGKHNGVPSRIMGYYISENT